MSETRLSTKRLLELLDLFERAYQPLSDIDGQPLRGVPGWDLGRVTSLSPNERESWLDCVGYAGCFPAPCGDEYVPVDLEEDGDPAVLDRYDTVFVDSITVAGRLCLQWCKGQPQAYSEKTGKPDNRGAYGLMGQEMIGWISHPMRPPSTGWRKRCAGCCG